MKGNELTILIITKNEAQNLIALLPSLNFANELIIVDSNSTDNTVEIAKKYTDKVFTRKFDNHGAQKNWGLTKVSNDWVFIIDADERVTDELKSEIENTFKLTSDNVAYWIKRTNIFMGKQINYSGWKNDKVIRLINKNFCKYDSNIIHEEITTNGKIGILKQKLLHNTYSSLTSYLEKIHGYTNKKAILKFNKNKKSNYFTIGFRPFFKFIFIYVFRLGFLDGKQGLIISSLTAYNVFLTMIKLYRLENGEKLE
ncbi:MAG: glycosyltransferase family 2 protein [Flavobacteriaceae bacterium]|nr:glycosyltransferase family 2 protein [Flavobacteriaceae bacterium]